MNSMVRGSGRKYLTYAVSWTLNFYFGDVRGGGRDDRQLPYSFSWAGFMPMEQQQILASLSDVFCSESALIRAVSL